tara:strand:- start:1634 stop:2014 length:381 start_codon:yes stop_codon:yes gene_type:complete
MYKHRPNGRGFYRRSNDNDKARLISVGFSNGRIKNNFKQNQSAEKLLERYKVLAKEALSSGDKILSENYLQHVDHFTRIILHKNSQQAENKTNIENETREQKQESQNSKGIELQQDTIPTKDKKNI